MHFIWNLISGVLLIHLTWKIVTNWRLARRPARYRKRISIPANTNLCEMPYEFYTDSKSPYGEHYIRETSNIAGSCL